jgi:hypothetical protein
MSGMYVLDTTYFRSNEMFGEQHVLLYTCSSMLALMALK